MPFDELPLFHELPSFAGLPGCAWKVWGEGDELGTVNLLTDEVVAHAAKEEIRYAVHIFSNKFFANMPFYRTGKRILLNW